MSTTTSLLCQQCTVGTVRSFHQNVASNREWKPRKRMNWSPSSAMLRCQRKDNKWRSSVWRYQSRRSSLSVRCASSTTGTEEKEPTIEELLTEIEQGTDKAAPRQRPLTRTTRTYSVQNEELVPDKVLTGRVKSIMTFGAFIDLGARIDGLLHISKLGEGFIKSVEDVLTVGQEVQVQIMEVDLPNRRVKLKMYNPIPKAEPAKSPFGSAPGGGREAFRGKIAGRGGPQVRRTETPKSNYQKGQAATGVVKNLTRRGCFVELPGGEEGFLHANEISAGGENSPIESLVQTGQEVKVKVLRIVDGRLNLTMKEEVDLKKLNEESNEHIFATNAFELAFRKNTIIRQYLEESGKLATVEPEGAKSKKKEVEVAKEETEEEKVPTAESEQSEKVEEDVEKEEDLAADKVPEAKVTEDKALKDKSPVALEEEEVVEDKVPEAEKILEKEEERAPSAEVKQEAEQSEKVQEEVEDTVVEKEEEVIKDKVPEAKVTEAEEGVLEKEEEKTAIPAAEEVVEDKAPEAKEQSEEVKEEVEDKSSVVEKEEEVVEDKVPEAKVTDSEEKVFEKEKEKEQEAEQEVQGNSPVKEEEVVDNKVPEAKATEVGEKVPEKVEVESTEADNIAEKVGKAPMTGAEKVEQEAEKSENVEDDKSPVFVEDKLASAVKTFTETSSPASGKKPSAVFEKAEKVDQEEDKPSALEVNKGAAAEKEVDKTIDVPENLSSVEELKAPEPIVEKEKAEDEEKPVIAETQDSIAVPDTKEKEEAIEESKKVDEIQEEAPASQEPEAIKGYASTKEAEAGTFEKNKASGISAALVKQLREQSGAGMMDCKKALVETNGNLEKAVEYLRKKGLAGADKKANRIAAEGLVGSYIHDGRIGVLLEVNSETDFVSRGEIFTQLVEDLGMQVAASQQAEYVSVEDVPADFRNKEFEIEMQREDLQSKPEAIRAKIVEGRITKRLGELALLEQPFIKNDSVLVKDLVKQTIASVGEKVQVRRFTRFVLGEGLEKRTHDLAAEVAAQTKVQEKAQDQVATETPIEKTDQPVKATTDEDQASVAISAALVKQLREETGTGMMDCKKALVETKGNFEQAKEYLRKKGLASAEKKVGRIAAEGLIVSYVHTGRIGVLMEVNCETDFVARNDVFKELAGDLAMQVVANPLVDYVSVDDVPAEVKEKEREIEMQREDLQNKPEQIRGKIVEGRLSKLLAERALLEQPFLKDDSILVKDMLKKTTATLGENIRVRRFVRYTLGEGIEKKSQNFAEEVAAQVKAM